MYEEHEIEDLAPWLIIITTLVGGALRVLLLANKGLWMDETLSIWVANHNVASMLQWIANVDQHPPLYYLLLHYWTALRGDSAYTVRFLSALFGTATIPVIYLIGKRLSGVVVGLAAAVLLAVSPFNIRFAQETRMYTLLVFNAAVAIYALVILLTDARSTKLIGRQFLEYLRAWFTNRPVEPESDGVFSYKPETYQTGWKARLFGRHRLPVTTIETDLAWVGFILFSAATLLTHNTAVLFFIATNIFVLGLMLYQRLIKPGSLPALQAPSFLNWLIAQIGILVLWSPWIRSFIQQAGRAFQEFWLPKPGLSTIVQALKTLVNEAAPGQPSQVILLWILYAVVFCVGLVAFRKKISQFVFLAALIVIPFLGELIVSIWQPVFLDQTLIWASIPLFLLLAAGIAQLRYRLVIILVLGILGTYNLFSVSDYFRFTQKDDWSNPAGFIARFVQKDDLILFNAPKTQIPFDYYFRVWEEQYSIQVEKHGAPVDLFASGVLEPKMTESDIPRLLSLLNGRKTVWLVNSHNTITDPLGLIPQTLASKMSLVYTRDFNGVQVQIYAAP